jgi:hypothetical protein
MQVVVVVMHSISSSECRAGFWGFVLVLLVTFFALRDGGICAGLV